MTHWQIVALVLGVAYIIQVGLFYRQTRLALRACDGWLEAVEAHNKTIDDFQKALRHG